MKDFKDQLFLGSASKTLYAPGEGPEALNGISFVFLFFKVPPRQDLSILSTLSALLILFLGCRAGFLLNDLMFQFVRGSCSKTSYRPMGGEDCVSQKMSCERLFFMLPECHKLSPITDVVDAELELFDKVLVDMSRSLTTFSFSFSVISFLGLLY